MIKRTLCFSHPAYLSLRNGQLVVKLEPHDDQPEKQATIPIEDIGFVVLDHRQITLSHGAMAALLDNNASVVTCDDRHMPVGLMLPLEGHTVQSERFQNQIEASLPLRKQLWQQTVQQKIRNQATLLQELHGIEVGNMRKWGGEVLSGDSTNLEGRAAAFYWSQMFPTIPDFTRSRDGVYPNTLLNYGYAILYTRVWQALLAARLNPFESLIHARQEGKPTLAFDMIEIFRSQVVDRIVISLIQKGQNLEVRNGLLTDKTRQLLVKSIMERLARYENYQGEEMKMENIILRQTKLLAKAFEGTDKFKPYLAKW